MILAEADFFVSCENLYWSKLEELSKGLVRLVISYHVHYFSMHFVGQGFSHFEMK